jgi:hypothetical protein
VPPEPAGTLHDEVGGSQVRHEEIEIHIEALLHYLCCDQHTAGTFGSSRVRPEQA